MSWKAEVIADASGKWCGNLLRFATEEEASVYVIDLAQRWILVRDIRTVETDDPVNVRVADVKLEHLDTKKKKEKTK